MLATRNVWGPQRGAAHGSLEIEDVSMRLVSSFLHVDVKAGGGAGRGGEQRPAASYALHDAWNQEATDSGSLVNR